MPETATWEHYAKPRWPRVYRYPVAADDAGARLARNIYPGVPDPQTRGSAWIGLALRVGRFAYCVKWADACLRPTTEETNHG